MNKHDPAIVVCDAGPFIHLDELDSLELLADFSRILTPSSVRKEVLRHRPRVFDRESLPIEIIDTVLSPSSKLAKLSHMLSLDQGEIDALALAESLVGCILLTDDNAARLAASELNIRVHGALAILLRAVRRGLRSRDEIVALLKEMPARSTLHIRQNLLLEAIQALEQN